MVFRLPSPVMFVQVCQLPETRFVRYNTVLVTPVCDWKANWKLVPTSRGWASITGFGPTKKSENAWEVKVTLVDQVLTALVEASTGVVKVMPGKLLET